MRYTTILLLTVVLMMSALPVWGQSALFHVDAASYKLQDDWAYLEVYTSVPRVNLSFEPVTEGADTIYEASFEVVCTILSGKQILASDTLDVIDTTSNTNTITSAQKLPHVFSFQIRAGTYGLKCQLIDRKRGLGDVREDMLVIPDYPDDQMAISDLEFAIRVDRDPGNSQFHKNGYLVYPNPQNIYGESLPRLAYYAELYNLPYEEGIPKLYHIDLEVLDSDKESYRSYPRKTRTIMGTSLVEVDGFPVTTYESGTYCLRVTLTDSSSGRKTSREKKFYVFHPTEIAERMITEDDGALRITFPTDYAMLDSGQIEKAITDIKYIMTPEEERQLKKLNLDGKRAFLGRFWAARDPDPSTMDNERRTQHYQLLEEANYLFGYLDIPGWKTDRGRIWITFGHPNSEESHPMEIDARAYKIWYYDQIEGGVEFVLVDRLGFGDYALVHSTKKGEVSNPDWYAREVQGYRARDRGSDFQPAPDGDTFWRE
jgi:GWxTD domain-containing protein